jgi:predicted MPP superfamily phosphohydrolase
MIITFISDTHTKHRLCESDLPGGDLLIHAGDFMNSGYSKKEATEFFNWFEAIGNYEDKIFIAGNHDRLMENEIGDMRNILSMYDINYLQDESFTLYFDGPNGDFPEDNVRIYGSPWQPEFYNWAFNLPRNSPQLEAVWNRIPDNTDILITHGPAQGILDTSGPPYNQPNLGCELLMKRIKEIKPKIHVCGHIHGGNGYWFEDGTHFINASILNERYEYVNKPITINWKQSTNEINF